MATENVQIIITGNSSQAVAAANEAAAAVQRVGESATITSAAAARSAKAVNLSMTKIATAMSNTGYVATRRLTVPLLAIGAVSGKMAYDFQKSMLQIQNLVGVSSKQVKAWSDQILKLSPQLGRSPKELADALYFIASSGIAAKDAINVLTASTKAAAIGLGETKQVADVVTSAMNAYKRSGLSASEATNTLAKAVKLGKGEADSFAPVMGRILPVSSKLKVSFQEVGAALASMTLLGATTAEAGTGIRAVMMSLMKPSAEANELFKHMGTSAAELRDQLGKKGLLPVLQYLSDRFKGNEEAMAKVFPNIRALVAAFNLTGENSKRTSEIFKQLTDDTDMMGKAWGDFQKTDVQKLNQAVSSLQASFVKLGAVLLPIFVPIMRVIADIVGNLADAFNKLPKGMKLAIVAFGAVVAAGGPLLIFFAAVLRSIAAIRTAFAVLRTEMAAGLPVPTMLGGGRGGGRGGSGGGLIFGRGGGGKAGGVRGVAGGGAMALLGLSFIDALSGDAPQAHDRGASGIIGDIQGSGFMKGWQNTPILNAPLNIALKIAAKIDPKVDWEQDPKATIARQFGKLGGSAQKAFLAHLKALPEDQGAYFGDLAQKAQQNARQMGLNAGAQFAHQFAASGKIGPWLKSFKMALAQMPPTARQSAANSAIALAAGLEAKGKLPEGSAAHLRETVLKQFEGMKVMSVKKAADIAKGMGGSFADMSNVTAAALTTMISNLNNALEELGGAKVDVTFKGFSKGAWKSLGQAGTTAGRQRGGSIGGFGTGDKVHAMLEPGEYVLNRKAVAAIGVDRLESFNRAVPRFQKGGQVPFNIGGGGASARTVRTGLSKAYHAAQAYYRKHAGPRDGLATYDGTRIAGWMVPWLNFARAHGWSGTVTSGYRSRASQSALYAAYLSGRGNLAARPGTSMHEQYKFPGGAVDLSDGPSARRTIPSFKSKFKPSMNYPSGEPWHFSYSGMQKGGMVRTGYTVYNDSPPGAFGGNLRNGYAELGTATSGGVGTGRGYLAQALGMKGELPYKFPLFVKINGHTKKMYKKDRGYGQGTSAYSIDIWKDSWNDFGLNQFSKGTAFVSTSRSGAGGVSVNVGGKKMSGKHIVSKLQSLTQSSFLTEVDKKAAQRAIDDINAGKNVKHAGVVLQSLQKKRARRMAARSGGIASGITRRSTRGITGVNFATSPSYSEEQEIFAGNIALFSTALSKLGTGDDALMKQIRHTRKRLRSIGKKHLSGRDKSRVYRMKEHLSVLRSGLATFRDNRATLRDLLVSQRNASQQDLSRSQTQQSIFSAFAGAPYLGAYKTGGVLPADGLYYGHRGETVIPASGSPVTVVLKGDIAQAVRAEIHGAGRSIDRQIGRNARQISFSPGS